MFSRLLLCVLIAGLFVGCETPYKKSDAAEKKAKQDFSKDPSFLSFIGRLKIGVGKRDRAVLASMMTTDFGYRWDNPPEGDNPFDYWDHHNLWGELSTILKQKFVPNDQYMVAPPAAAEDPNYAGYRVGLRLVNGSWRFAYFVPTESAQ